ncbi:hypothetical protein BOTBODRAFT_28253 [Botryobasidium botryosum FD-172 SS1]|uniref:F-box domain-containing protein n=1 Tax=Botryobasidium botryosum (strain FD-172 SS1) TaxID=930990 RepID=A0A067MVC0_BOTB1|nr:hypothetical protein BOTBODRAFT_28253 [Botryobasidium botryosum FD-172 SS1]
MGLPRLPSEVIIQIIEELDLMGYPRPLAYDRSAVNTTALCQLTLVNRSFHIWTTPFLYRCASLVTPVRISLFARTLRDLSSCESKSKHVRVVRFSGFDQFLHARSVRNICAILRAISPSLQRLFIDLPLLLIDPEQPNNVKHKYEPLSRAFQGLSPHTLVEFVSGRDDLFLGQVGSGALVWSNWTGLRRLALCAPALYDYFFRMLSHLPFLEILALTDPLDFDDDLQGTLPSSLHRVVLIVDCTYSVPELKARVDYWEVCISAMAMERGAPVDFVRIYLPREIDAADWTKEKVATGELWEIDHCPLAKLAKSLGGTRALISTGAGRTSSLVR